MSENTQKRPMREVMPESAAVVDAFREAGLTDNATIAAGMKTGAFWFKEGDHAVGKDGARIAADDLVQRSRIASARAEAAWQEECRTFPRLAHMYNLQAFREMQEGGL